MTSTFWRMTGMDGAEQASSARHLGDIAARQWACISFPQIRF
ncbi:hypothetical protein ACFL45_04080 [Candidatus Neomarinimicrobiota bacterium]